MTGKPERLQRLVHAQGQLVKALEAAVRRAEQSASTLSATQAQLDGMAAEAGKDQPALVPPLLRSLAETTAQVKQARLDMEAIQHRLVAAKSREKAIASRAKLIMDAGRRKAGEGEALEAALAISAKASGKGRVVF